MIEKPSYQTTAYNLLLFKHTKEILSALKKDDIPVIVLKGIALAELIYPHIGMREISDIDLLIKEKDFCKTSQKLIELGYSLQKGTTFPTYIKEGRIPIIVELHTGVPYAKEKEIWKNLMPINIDGKETYTLSLEDNLIYLCYHSTVCHFGSELKCLHDIHLLISHYLEDINWHILAKRIILYGLSAPCYYTFLKVRELFNAEIPDYLVDSIKPKNIFQVIVFKQVFKKRLYLPHIAYILQALIRPWFILSYFYPTAKSLRIRYNVNSPSVYLFYLIHPFYQLLRIFKVLLIFLLQSLKNVVIFNKIYYGRIIERGLG